MRRRASIFGMLLVGAILAINPGPVSRVVTSARNVERCFNDLRNAGSSLSTIERVLFSLVLANTKSGPVEIQVEAGDTSRP
jgi:hypothetical protein